MSRKQQVYYNYLYVYSKKNPCEEWMMMSVQARGDGKHTPGGMMGGNDAHDEC